MHKIVMWLGGVAAALGVFFFLMILLVAPGGRTAAVVTAVSIGGGLILSGAVLYCFGAIVEHLIAIQNNTEQQLRIFEERLAKKD